MKRTKYVKFARTVSSCEKIAVALFIIIRKPYKTKIMLRKNVLNFSSPLKVIQNKYVMKMSIRSELVASPYINCH